MNRGVYDRREEMEINENIKKTGRMKRFVSYIENITKGKITKDIENWKYCVGEKWCDWCNQTLKMEYILESVPSS